MRDCGRSRRANVGSVSRRGRRHDLESSSGHKWFWLRSLVLLSADSKSLRRIDSGRESPVQPSWGGVQAVPGLVPDNDESRRNLNLNLPAIATMLPQQSPWRESWSYREL